MKLMQVWIVCFVLFFGAAELYQWAQGVTLPMPVFVVAGVLLAIASNAQIWQKQNSLQLKQPAPEAESAQSTPTTWINLDTPPIATAPRRYYPGAQLPNLTPEAERSISFTVQKTKAVSEVENLGKDRG